MTVKGIEKAAPKSTPARAGASVDAIKNFGETSGMFDDWKAFKPSNASALKGEARAKFNLLAGRKDGWSGRKNEPLVFTANVDGARTMWVTVANDHGSQAYVFDPFGRPLASGFMPETGDSFHWQKGFHQPDYVNN